MSSMILPTVTRLASSWDKRPSQAVCLPKLVVVVKSHGNASGWFCFPHGERNKKTLGSEARDEIFKKFSSSQECWGDKRITKLGFLLTYTFQIFERQWGFHRNWEFQDSQVILQNKGPLSKAKYAHRKSCDGIREYEKEKISKVSLIKYKDNGNCNKRYWVPTVCRTLL